MPQRPLESHAFVQQRPPVAQYFRRAVSTCVNRSAHARDHGSTASSPLSSMTLQSDMAAVELQDVPARVCLASERTGSHHDRRQYGHGGRHRTGLVRKVRRSSVLPFFRARRGLLVAGTSSHDDCHFDIVNFDTRSWSKRRRSSESPEPQAKSTSHGWQRSLGKMDRIPMSKTNGHGC